ncbi:hypothetical protein H2203_003190 [Taxawa tesnikishii (nom. ined.)]|nr:hypothetical protein H2203_003190 [Dothideales sp. JES 119]
MPRLTDEDLYIFDSSPSPSSVDDTLSNPTKRQRSIEDDYRAREQDQRAKRRKDDGIPSDGIDEAPPTSSNIEAIEQRLQNIVSGVVNDATERILATLGARLNALETRMDQMQREWRQRFAHPPQQQYQSHHQTAPNGHHAAPTTCQEPRIIESVEGRAFASSIQPAPTPNESPGDTDTVDENLSSFMSQETQDPFIASLLAEAGKEGQGQYGHERNVHSGQALYDSDGHPLTLYDRRGRMRGNTPGRERPFRRRRLPHPSAALTQQSNPPGTPTEVEENESPLGMAEGVEIARTHWGVDAPQYTVARGTDTVVELWTEWYVGTSVKPPIAELDRRYGSLWSVYYSMRRTLIDEHLRRLSTLGIPAGKAGGEAGLQVAKEMDLERENARATLNQYTSLIKTRDKARTPPLVDPRGLAPNARVTAARVEKSRTASLVPPPPLDEPQPPRVVFSRTTATVAELWKEWFNGKADGTLAVVAIDREWGDAWRRPGSEEYRLHHQRKIVIDAAVDRAMTRGGFSHGPEVAREMDKERLSLHLTLPAYCDRLRELREKERMEHGKRKERGDREA